MGEWHTLNQGTAVHCPQLGNEPPAHDGDRLPVSWCGAVAGPGLFTSGMTLGKALTLPVSGSAREESGDCRSANSACCCGCSVRCSVRASESCVCEEGRTGGK